MKQETLKGKFIYDGNSDTYTATVRKPPCLWWLLLLLLPLLLFIRCEREVTVTVEDRAGGKVANVNLNLSRAEADLSERTDSAGNATFRSSKLSYNGWDYIFRTDKMMKITANPPAPYLDKTVQENFYSSDHVVIVLDEPAFTAQVQVTDVISHNPIAGAEVAATANGSALGVYTTDSNGMANIPNIRASDKLSLAGRAPDYETNDTTLANITGKYLQEPPVKQIPLQKKYQCDDNVSYNSTATPVVDIKNIDMHKDSGTFTLSVYTLNQPDQVLVFDANGNLLCDTKLISTYNNWQDFKNIRFNTRTINLRVIADPSNPTSSIWEVRPHCPD